MKNSMLKNILLIGLAMGALSGTTQAQEQDKESRGPSFFRPYDKTGINRFETNKDDYDKPYQGFKVSFGGGFTAQYQSLKHQNPGALNNNINGAEPADRANALTPIRPGFMTAQANLNIDVQLADGIRLNLSNYLSSRHHNEFWVKGGYIQMDKLPFDLDFTNELMRYVTVKVGHMEINYGDDHFRRPDGGHTLYAPFMEGNIMDAFATEIAGEVYVQHKGVFGMVGLSNGMIKGSVDSLSHNSDGTHKARPSIYFKGGIDRQLNEHTRVRLSGSWYHNTGSNGSGLTLYNGDRTGSNYQNVMEKKFNASGAATPGTGMFSSGRYSPDFSGKLDAVMLNAFAKVYGFEINGTYEIASGHGKMENKTDDKVKSRQANQFAVDALYRFGPKENFYAGARYNQVKAEQYAYDKKVDINRYALAGGWFVTNNLLLKAEYVKQQYKNFKNTDYRHNGKFNGLVIEAVVGF